MEQQFLSLFQSAKKSADVAATSSSLMPEVNRCLDALDQLERFPVISSRVLLSTPVAQQVACLTKHRVKLIRTAASSVLDTWSRKLYARDPAIDGKTKVTNSGSTSRTGTPIVKMHGRVTGRINVGMPIQTVKTEEKKIREETEEGFRSLRKPPPAPANQIIHPEEKVKSNRSCFRKPSLAPSKQIRNQAWKVKGIRSGLRKPSQASATCVTVQEKVTGFTSLKKPSEEPVKFDEALRAKVRSILVESLNRVVKEAGPGLRKTVNLSDPICVAAEVESIMLEKMGPFNGAKTMKYRSILFNMKDPKNPDLRRKVLLGQIKPEKLVTMTSEEMASNQRQFENEQIRKKSSCKKMNNAERECKSVDPMEY